MKLLAWVYVVVLLIGTTEIGAAPLYQAGEKGSVSRSLLHGEISAGYVLSSHKIEYTTGEDASPRLKGAEMRALWTPLPWLSVGADFEKLGNEKLSPLVKQYGVRRWAGIVKLTLSPNTSPRLYLIGGYGKSKHEIKYDFQARWFPPVTQRWTYWMLGLGLETNVWKGIFVAGEGSWIHYNNDCLTSFFKISSRTEMDLRLRMGLRF